MKRINEIRKILVSMITFVLVLGIVGCSGSGNGDMITIFDDLKLKQEYASIIDDTVVEDAISKVYTSIVNKYNNRDKDTNLIEMDNEILVALNIIQTSAQLSMDDDNKFDSLLDLASIFTVIIDGTKYKEPLLDKNENGEYIIENGAHISPEDILIIKEEITNNLNKYFE
ncbi:hypothetical protein [Paenibacillus wynnii]|uniref:hypothetical protein n=1 Tax=Paenibacillus wynnii TaxID=268407 RepID=UPI00279357E1|nr:hypothetical protein [Paenibacillus wynnii]MDQ0193081.1 hypothetical protein [Paenibacillus wynnii]